MVTEPPLGLTRFQSKLPMAASTPAFSRTQSGSAMAATFGQHLGGERFVDLPQSDVGEAEAMPREQSGIP